MARALITGIAGFAGSHLAEHLAGQGWEVSGLERPGVPLANLGPLEGPLPVRVVECDILDPADLARVVRELSPDAVFHLAAVAFVPAAERSPGICLDVNAKGTLNLCRAVREGAPRARLVFASSAEVYGKTSPEEMPLVEERPLRPANIYALTKRCAEEIVLFHHRSGGPEAVILRPFNHIGPRQDANFVTSSFAAQIAAMEAGRREPVLMVGNLEAERDFTDVRDMARAYRLAAERAAAGEVYNVCSGRAHRIGDILDRLLSMSRLRIEVRQDPSRLRKAEIPVLYGSHTKFTAATGWRPEIGLDETLRSILDSHRI